MEKSKFRYGLRCKALVGITVICAASFAQRLHTDKVEQSYAQSWHAADSLASSGLTQSALDTVNRIYTQAKKADNQPQMLKAVIYRIKLESYGEEDAFVKSLIGLEEEIKTSKFPATPLLHSMLAEFYFKYYQNNRFRFPGPTPVDNMKPGDIHSWDVRTIFDKMSVEFSLSLQNSAALKKTPLTLCADILKGSGGDAKLRPTLYDFLAFRAIDFLSTDDGGLINPDSQFTINSPDYFGSFEKFTALKLSPPDTSSFKFRALKLLQDLIIFHADNNDVEALIDADIFRLSFVRRHATLPEKDSLYLKALESLESLAPYSPASAEVIYHRAELMHEWAQSFIVNHNERYRLKECEALELCEKAIAAFPESYGAGLCKSLALEITAKNISLTMETVEPPGKPFKALCAYKNLNRIYWRQIAIGFEDYQAIVRRQSGDSIVRSLTKIKPVNQWSVSVPNPIDHQNHSVELEIPALSLGHYVILCASDSNFSLGNQAATFEPVQISSISLIDRSIANGGREFYVLDRETGVPMKGITINVRQSEYDEKLRDYKKLLIGRYRSDKDGHCIIPPEKRPMNTISIDCEKANDRFYAANGYDLSNNRQSPSAGALHTFFFIDRAIYRPGQTVYFKGIMVRLGEEKRNVAANQKTVVSFVNANNQPLSPIALTSNKYGSIQGSFIAPINSLNGRMGIQNESGSIGFLVEDYKLPKLEVTKNPAKESARLGDTIHAGNASQTLAFGIGKQVKWEPDLSIPITTAHLNGVFEPGQGAVVIYKLAPPHRIFADRVWSAPDTASLTQPRQDENESDMTKWQHADKVFEGPFDTHKNRTLKLWGAQDWKPGAYVIEGRMKDKSGQELTCVNYFTLYSDISGALPYAMADWFVPVKTECKPGEKAIFIVGSGYPSVKMLYEIEHKNEIIKKDWITLHNEQKRIEIPLEEKYRDNCTVHFTFVCNNRGYQHSAIINAPWTNKELDISFETFPDKIVPGKHAEWRMKIAGKNKDIAAAEMVVALYGASLDSLTPLHWDFDIYSSFSASREWNTRHFAHIETSSPNVNSGVYSSASRNYPLLN